MKKRSRESALWVLTAILVVTLFRWNCSVKRWLPNKEVESSMFLSKNSNTWPKLLFLWRDNWCVFLAGLRLQLSSFPRWNIAFSHGGPVPRFIKTCTPAVLDSVKNSWDTLYHSMRKRSGESVQWVLTVIHAVTLIRWNYCQKTSQQEMAIRGFLSENSNYWPKLLLLWIDKWTGVFFLVFWDCKYPAFRGG